MARQQASLQHGGTAAGTTSARFRRSTARFRPRSWSDATSFTRASSSLSTTRRPALLKRPTRAASALPRCRSFSCSATTARGSRASSTTSSGGASRRLGSHPRTTGVFALLVQSSHVGPFIFLPWLSFSLHLVLRCPRRSSTNYLCTAQLFEGLQYPRRATVVYSLRCPKVLNCNRTTV